MKYFKTVICAMSMAATLGFCITPGMAAQKGDTVHAGFTGLPLRYCQGTYCAEVNKLQLGQQLKVLLNDTGAGWSNVEVVGTGERGWICNANVF